MSFTNTLQYKLLNKRMIYAQKQQEVATDNIARSGIAGEKTKEATSFEKTLRRSSAPPSLKTTNPRHIGNPSREPSIKIVTSRDQPETSLAGNSISPEEQLLKFNEATTEFFRLEQVRKNERDRLHKISTLGRK